MSVIEAIKERDLINNEIDSGDKGFFIFNKISVTILLLAALSSLLILTLPYTAPLLLASHPLALAYITAGAKAVLSFEAFYSAITTIYTTLAKLGPKKK